MTIISELISKCLRFYHREKFLYLFNKKDFIKAYDLLKYMIELKYWHNTGLANVMCGRLEFLAYNNFQKAREYLDEAYYTWGYNFNAEEFGLYGYILYSLGDYDRGIEFMEKSIEMNSSEKNLSYFATALSNNHDKRSIDLRGKILDKNPRNCRNRAYLAMDLAETGQKENAFIEARQAEICAHKADDFYICGLMYEKLNDNQKALDFYKKCEKLHYTPEFKLYYSFAQCYYNIGNATEATNYAIKSLQLNYDYSLAKGLLLSAIKTNESEINFDQFINEHEGTCLIYIIHALQSIKNEKHVNADSYLSQAEQLNPSLEELYHIGNLYEMRGNIGTALKLYNECEQKSFWNKSCLYESVINCYILLEDYISAIQYCIKDL